MRNLHQFYYKKYFEGINFEFLSQGKKEAPDSEIKKIKGKNRDLTCSSLLHEIARNPIANQHFQLKISYPGLVTGVGINHEAKIKGEFNLGVHFDYTYGMPVVYGSSVKGVLRSVFKQDGFIDDSFLKDVNKRLKAEDQIDVRWFVDNYKKIEKSIFEGEENGQPKSIYNRDIFFDAVITKADSKGRILCSDSITPHGANPLKNPTPITFLKIAPGCTMEFRFKLVDSEIDGKKFTADQKRAMFEEIIKTVGVGAKTNVGYGQFE